MKTTILFVRHGESEGNVLGVFSGHSGYPLSELGHKQAAKTAEYIRANYQVDAVYCSDLPRAFQTAEHTANAFGLPVVTNAGLREICAGDWENCRYVDLAASYGDTYSMWSTDFWNAYCVGGETVKQVGERAVNALSSIAEANPGKCIVVAAHATTIRGALCKISELYEPAVQTYGWGGNCAISELTYSDGKFVVISANQADHLADMLTELPSSL